jgi:hypothetical protein
MTNDMIAAIELTVKPGMPFQAMIFLQGAVFWALPLLPASIACQHLNYNTVEIKTTVTNHVQTIDFVALVVVCPAMKGRKKYLTMIMLTLFTRSCVERLQGLARANRRVIKRIIQA